jgi:dCMP deaminase
MKKWDKRFLDLAHHVAEWSRDPSTKVGAVIVRPNKTVASLGFNGFPRGVVDAPERYFEREVKYAMVVHAEPNAILMAQEPLDHYTLYTTHFPCAQCAASIIQSGITDVITMHPSERMKERWGDSFIYAKQMFTEAGVVYSMYQLTDLVEDGNVPYIQQP